MGGEAVLDPRAAQHVRRRERRARGLVVLVMGLTFVGGLALGAVVGTLWRRR
jgi:hypothetical protein